MCKGVGNHLSERGFVIFSYTRLRDDYRNTQLNLFFMMAENKGLSFMTQTSRGNASLSPPPFYCEQS